MKLALPGFPENATAASNHARLVHLHAELARVRAELELSHREITALRNRMAWAIGNRGSTAGRQIDGLTPHQTTIVRILAGRQFIATDHTTHCRRHICELRARLDAGGAGVSIRTDRFRSGYWVDDDSRARLEALLTGAMTLTRSGQQARFA